MLHIRIFTFNPLSTNCIVAWADGSGKCTVTDPGMSSPEGCRELTDFLEARGLVPEAILLTHGHFDHIWGVEKLRACFPGLPVYLHPADKNISEKMALGFPAMQDFAFRKQAFPSEDISDGQRLSLGGADWQVLHTPGHSPGSVCFYCAADNLLLSGDTLFAGTIGRTDLPGGDYDELMRSIREKVLVLPGDTDVIPGHGQPTNLLREATANPFLQPFNEPDTDWGNQDGLFVRTS